jgi:hypothetical protein
MMVGWWKKQQNNKIEYWKLQAAAQSTANCCEASLFYITETTVMATLK